MDKTWFYKKVLTLLSFCFDYLSRPQLKVMAQLVTTLWSAKSVTLWKIAFFLPGDNDVDVKQNHKRLVYFLDNFKLTKNFWKSYIKFLFCLPYFKLLKRKVITILLDTTTLKDDFWILAATVSFMGRSIPIYLKIWRDPNRSYDFWGRVEGFLEELKELLPKRFQYVIIADRGFQGKRLVDICLRMDWRYIIRINDSYLIREKDKTYVQLGIFDVGFYEGVELGKNSKIKTNLVVSEVKGEYGRRRWYLMTDMVGKEEVVELYSSRMWIEESFRDLKQELGWEKYTEKIPSKGRLEKVVVISLISYVIGLSLGLKEEEERGSDRDNGRRKISLMKRFQQLINGVRERVERIILKFVSLFRQRYYRIRYTFA